MVLTLSAIRSEILRVNSLGCHRCCTHLWNRRLRQFVNITALETWQSWSHPQASLSPELEPCCSCFLLSHCSGPLCLLLSQLCILHLPPLCLQSLAFHSSLLRCLPHPHWWLWIGPLWSPHTNGVNSRPLPTSVLQALPGLPKISQ